VLARAVPPDALFDATMHADYLEHAAARDTVEAT
jgi:hypothetical protein